MSGDLQSVHTSLQHLEFKVCCLEKFARSEGLRSGNAKQVPIKMKDVE